MLMVYNLTNSGTLNKKSITLTWKGLSLGYKGWVPQQHPNHVKYQFKPKPKSV